MKLPRYFDKLWSFRPGTVVALSRQCVQGLGDKADEASKGQLCSLEVNSCGLSLACVEFPIGSQSCQPEEIQEALEVLRDTGACRGWLVIRIREVPKRFL